VLQFLPPRHEEGEESLGELTDRGSGWKTDIFGPAMINADNGVRMRVDEVGEPWRTKGCGGRSSSGERPGLSTPFIPTGWWEVAGKGSGLRW
jgi:hypothetical protein